jgi:hypothetical protein
MTTATVDLIDATAMTGDLTVATTTEIVTIIAMMIVATTTVMTAVMITVMSDLIITTLFATKVATTTGMMTVTAERSLLHYHPNRNGAFQNTKRKINFIVGGRQATKSNRQQRSNAREIGQVNTETPQPLRWSEFPITFSKKDHRVHTDPGTYPLVVNPIVYDPFLPRTIIDGTRA